MKWPPRRARPSGAVPWRDTEYLVIDVETTGLDLKNDAVVSYGAVVIRGGRLIANTQTYGLACPPTDISAESITIHTLRRIDVEDAASPDELAVTLATLVRERVIVAHSAWIEEAFLGRALRHAGVRLPTPTIDTAAMCRVLGIDTPVARADPRLEWAANELHVPVVSPHHAMGDAITTAHVFLAAACALELRGYVTTRDLQDLSAGDRHVRSRM
ncbi:PolC-type DNA polymerase III [Gordonia polyisoprenivorans]|uniref:3'-5' exonuclease n=1 Tax=Gordonia polyisoprenivorans TaxID=84595 RepID=UPI00037BC6C9|nr:3'-5' exonuclease [Gordonia polyisoprenivorans]